MTMTMTNPTLLSLQLWSLVAIAIATALIIPTSPPSISNPRIITITPPQIQIQIQNYTSHPLNTSALLPPPSCPQSFLGVFNALPTPPQTLNITQCHSQCETTNDMFRSEGSNQKCRAFNVYMLYRDGVGLGMQCVLYQNRWGDGWGVSDGSLDAWGRRRDGVDGDGDEDMAVYSVRESWGFWLTEDIGEDVCGTDGGDGNGNVTGTAAIVGNASSATSGFVSITRAPSLATGKSSPSKTMTLKTSGIPTRTSTMVTKKAKTRITISNPAATNRQLKGMKTLTRKTSSEARFTIVTVR